MLDEWLIYESPSLKRLVAMPAPHYDKWARDVTEKTRQEYPVVARGLTQEQAEKMIELTQEKEDEI
jgi:hypothetical protein